MNGAIFKIVFPSSKDGSSHVTHYSYEEKTRMMAFLNTVVESGRIAVVAKGRYEDWKQERDYEKAGIVTDG